MGRETHLWMKMRWYAEVGAHAVAPHRAPNSVLRPQICKVVCFLFRSGGISLRGIASDDLGCARSGAGLTLTAGAALADSVWLSLNREGGERKTTPLTLHQQARSQREHVEVGEALR